MQWHLHKDIICSVKQSKGTQQNANTIRSQKPWPQGLQQHPTLVVVLRQLSVCACYTTTLIIVYGGLYSVIDCLVESTNGEKTQATHFCRYCMYICTLLGYM